MNNRCPRCGDYYIGKRHRAICMSGRKKKSSQARPNPQAIIYDATRGIVLEGMQKGSSSKFAGEKFRHRFKHPVEIIGLPNGDVLLRSKRKR